MPHPIILAFCPFVVTDFATCWRDVSPNNFDCYQSPSLTYCVCNQAGTWSLTVNRIKLRIKQMTPGQVGVNFVYLSNLTHRPTILSSSTTPPNVVQNVNTYRGKLDLASFFTNTLFPICTILLVSQKELKLNQQDAYSPISSSFVM